MFTESHIRLEQSGDNCSPRTTKTKTLMLLVNVDVPKFIPSMSSTAAPHLFKPVTLTLLYILCFSRLDLLSLTNTQKTSSF